MPTESENQSEAGSSTIEGSGKKRRTPGSVKKFKPTEQPKSQYSELFKFNMSDTFSKQPPKHAISSSVGFKGKDGLAPLGKRAGGEEEGEDPKEYLISDRNLEK